MISDLRFAIYCDFRFEASPSQFVNGQSQIATGKIWLVMHEVIAPMSIGFAIGIPAALALGRYVAAQLYGIPPHDPLMAGAAVILLTTVSAVAGLIPAQRASRIDPILALRYE